MPVSAIENLGAVFAGRTAKQWKLVELRTAAADGMKGRDYENGRKVFSAAACYACHRFGNGGGITGPDLAASGGRYSPHGLLDQIIHASKEINERYASIILTKTNGETLSGVILNLSGDTAEFNTKPSDPGQRVTIDRKEVKSIEPFAVSSMPPGLLSMLTREEILDLLAYTLGGGDKDHAMFAK